MYEHRRKVTKFEEFVQQNKRKKQLTISQPLPLNTPVLEQEYTMEVAMMAKMEAMPGFHDMYPTFQG